MAKIPHIDFKSRDVLDGTEEIYTQNLNYDPEEPQYFWRLFFIGKG